MHLPTPSLSTDYSAAEKTLRAILGVTEWTTSIATCELDSNRFVWVPLWHPSHGNWCSLKCSYLHAKVVPAITEGRALALGGS